jgi:uncharacterized membrane protein YozB (DUF420 family)
MGSGVRDRVEPDRRRRVDGVCRHSAGLIRSRRVRWHRMAGWVGAVIAASVVVTGSLAAVLSAAGGSNATLPPMPLDFMGVIVSGVLMFGAFVGLAVMYRRNLPAHKRLMYLATVNLLQAAVV